MLLLKLGSELQNLIEKFKAILKIETRQKLDFQEVEYFQVR